MGPNASGAHKPGAGVLAEPSAALSLLWLLRSLRFQLQLLDGIVKDGGRSGGSRSGGGKGAPLAAIAREAYTHTLEPHHGLWLRSTVRTALGTMPTREALYLKMAPEVRDATERAARCRAELPALCEAQRAAIGGLAELMGAMELDDHRKA